MLENTHVELFSKCYLPLTDSKLALEVGALSKSVKNIQLTMKEKKGTTTEAELAKSKIDLGELVPCKEQFRSLLLNYKVPWWICNDDVWKKKFPKANSSEKDICQPFVTKILDPFTQAGISNTWIRNPRSLFPRRSNNLRDIELTSTVDNKAYQVVSFGSRKPDVVSYEKGCAGVAGITCFGDVKRSGAGDFTYQEMGHILDMGFDLMEIQRDRSFLICFLTDGDRFQFFHIERRENNYLSQYSAVYRGFDGWQVMLRAIYYPFLLLTIFILNIVHAYRFSPDFFVRH